MKYLKKIFESGLCQEIDEKSWNLKVGYDDVSSGKVDNFTDSELGKLVRLFLTISVDTSYPYLVHVDKLSLTITKTEDDWFFIYDKDNFKFYKCDTLEGVDEFYKEFYKSKPKLRTRTFGPK